MNDSRGLLQLKAILGAWQPNERTCPDCWGTGRIYPGAITTGIFTCRLCRGLGTVMVKK